MVVYPYRHAELVSAFPAEERELSIDILKRVQDDDLTGLCSGRRSGALAFEHCVSQGSASSAEHSV